MLWMSGRFVIRDGTRRVAHERYDGDDVLTVRKRNQGTLYDAADEGGRAQVLARRNGGVWEQVGADDGTFERITSAVESEPMPESSVVIEPKAGR